MIKSLNLDNNFKPTIYPEIKYTKFKFSGGEVHIKTKYENIPDTVIITHRLNTSNNIMELFLAKDAIQRLGVKNIEVIIPYVPYARQDRPCEIGEAFSLKVFANLLNSMNFDAVYILDPHSDVAPALIENSVPISNHKFIEEIMKDLPADIVLISPDAGSSKKLHKLMKFGFSDFIQCDKIRDTKTGKITGFSVGNDDIYKRNCLIIDDICDGGATFVGLAKELKRYGAGDLYLAVTHGIFSKGIIELSKYFKSIFTTDSIITYDSESIFEIEKQYNLIVKQIPIKIYL